MEWRFNSSAPIYAQLVDQLTLRIVTGIYAPGQRVPAVRELALEAGVNPNTMQRALGELERLGLVYAQRTSGRFVTVDTSLIDDAKRSLAEAQIYTFLGAMDELGYGEDEILAMLREARMKEERR